MRVVTTIFTCHTACNEYEPKQMHDFCVNGHPRARMCTFLPRSARRTGCHLQSKLDSGFLFQDDERPFAQECAQLRACSELSELTIKLFFTHIAIRPSSTAWVRRPCEATTDQNNTLSFLPKETQFPAKITSESGTAFV